MSEAGPSRSQPREEASRAAAAEPEEEDDDERVDLKLIQSFADKIQHLPTGETTERVRITVPKRGEKDFEPLAETTNLQEMMLQKSREALFNAMVGVRGGNSKSMSHALLSPSTPYPSILITRGHMLDTMGASIKRGKTRTELLPEEALYLLERGSLQIWVGDGEWSDEEWGVSGAVEMSVMEGFSALLGKDGLTWERYQAYAYLKRLGYTVQRTRRFLPAHFLPALRLDQHDTRMAAFRTWWRSIPGWIAALARTVGRVMGKMYHALRRADPRSLVAGWRGSDFASLFAHLRVTPPPPPRPRPDTNPYMPFFHVWKPATAWSKAKWDRGSDEGLARQRPDYAVAAVDARITPLPSAAQLEEVFEGLPDEPKGPIKKAGPQYKPRSSPPTTRPFGSILGALRNGDRALVVAVNDSGNTGWVRFGRTGFASEAIM